MFGKFVRRRTSEWNAAEMMERKQIRRVNRAKAQKQQQERKKLLLMILMTILIVFGIGFGFGTLFTRAQEPEQDSAHKYFTSIEIEKGDTLWNIAGEYMDDTHYMSREDYLNEVMTINRMTNSKLVSGHKLIVPYYSDDMM